MNNLGGIGRFLVNVFLTQTQNFAAFTKGQNISATPNVQTPQTGNQLPPALLMSQNDIVTVNNELTLLNTKEAVSQLKEAMQLPDEFSQLMQLLTQKDGGIISAKTLKAFIEAHAKNAVIRLATAQEALAQKGIMKNNQINDLAKIVAGLANSNEENPAVLMKSLILLYLPWVPLDKNIDFEINYSSAQNEDGEEFDIITVVIQTIHYGIIKVVLMLNVKDGYSVDMKLFASDTFPKEEFFEDIKSEKEPNLNTNIAYESIQLQKTELKNNKQKIDLQSVGEINPILFRVAQKVIRLIIDIDKRTELHTRRREGLN